MQGCNRKQYATSNVVLPGIRRVLVDSDVVQVPTIANVSVPTANTEVSFSFPTGTKRFELRARNTAVLKLSYAAGQSGSTFLSIPAGSSYLEDGIDPSMAITIYLQTAVASTTVEIVSWS
jgi:hypothetical protein